MTAVGISRVAVPLDAAIVGALGLELWRVDLDAQREPPDAALAVLDGSERTRLRRFLRIGDRARFACVRAALRRRLGARLGLRAEAVPIRIDARGKPRLPDDRLWFSLAHSGDHGLVAIGAAPIGTDIEQARDLERLDALADMILAASERPIWQSAGPERRRALFLRAWTAKEAVLKAAGSGLLTDPRAVAVLAEDGALLLHAPADGLALDPAATVMRAVPAPAGYAAALALLLPQTGRDRISP